MAIVFLLFFVTCSCGASGLKVHSENATFINASLPGFWKLPTVNMICSDGVQHATNHYCDLWCCARACNQGSRCTHFTWVSNTECRLSTKGCTSRVPGVFNHTEVIYAKQGGLGVGSVKHHIVLPHKARIAIVLRGGSFRSGRFSKSCDVRNRLSQITATHSLMSMIVQPLVGAGNLVDILALFGDGVCDLTVLLRQIYGKYLVASESFESQSQVDGVRRALDLLKFHAGFWTVARQYSYVMIVRHDMMWTMPVNEWPTANFGLFNFLNECEPWTEHVDHCVSDVFYMMPASKFAMFDSVVGDSSCFGPLSSYNGHGCYKDLTALIAPNMITFVTDSRGNIRRDVEGSGDLDVGYLT